MTIEKPLHERLRDGLENLAGGTFVLKTASGSCAIYGKPARVIADEIERTYITREQHEAEVKAIVEAQTNGRGVGNHSPHHIMKTYAAFNGMPMCDKESITEWLDRWFVKRPAPKVLDADGVEIKEDDTMFGTGREQHRYTVQSPYSINKEVGERFCVRCYDHDEGNIVWCDPSMLTHREPDSLEKLLNDIRDYLANGVVIDRRIRPWEQRLAALIERGA